MAVEDILREKRADILRVAAKHGAKNVRVFGSAVRGEAGPESDLDLLVDIEPEYFPWFPAGLVLELEDLLGRKVNVVTEESLAPSPPNPERGKAVVKDNRLYLARILERIGRIET